MINANNFGLFRNDELIQNGRDLSKTIADANPTALGIKKQYDNFNSVVVELDDLYKISQKNPLTQVLIDLDEKRDNLFMGICFIVDAHLKHWSPEVVAQARLISDSIDVYGRNLTVFNYQSESANISSLIDTWEKDSKMMDALKTMHLESWKDELAATNNLFINTYTKRSQDEGKSEALPKIKELRQKFIFTWTKLENIILGKMEEFEDDAEKAILYRNLINNINGVLDSYNNLLTIRQGKRAAKKEKSTDTPTA